MEPLYFSPAQKHSEEFVDIYDWDSHKYLGKIKQVPYTYSVVGNINEHQVAIGETTFTGREELQDTNGLIDYGSLMYLALQRSKTAREALKVMTDLVAEYGYYSTGESFSVADANEVWILEMIGKGPSEKGGYYDPKSGKRFSFVDAYNPLDPGGALYCEGRVWSLFSRAAPSLNLSDDYWRALKDAEP